MRVSTGLSEAFDGARISRAESRRALARRLDVGAGHTAVQPSDWPLLPVVAAFALGWLAFAWPWLSGAVTIPWDAKAHFAPQIQFMAQALARGESPFWQPYAYSGLPQIADPQSMLFSPPFLVLAAVDGNPSLTAIDATIWLAVLAAGVGVIWFARDLGWHWGGALVAALGFCFGAAMAWRLQHFGQVLSLGYLPIALLALRRGMLGGHVGWGMVAGLFAAFIVLGRDQVGLLAIYILAAHALWLLLTAQDRWRAAQRALPVLAGGALVGVLVVALPLLMTLLYAAGSNRPAIDFTGAGRGSLHPALGLTALVPQLYGAAGEMAAYWGPPSFAWRDTDLFIAQNMGQLYISMPLVLLLIVGLARGVLFDREIAFFTGVLALATLYALGWYTPFFRACYDLLPGVAYFRRPADAVFVVGAFASLCAGYVAHRWLSDTLPSASGVRQGLEISLPIAGFVAAIALASQFERLELASRPIAFAVIWAGLAVLVLAAVDHLRMIRPVAAALLLGGLVATDLIANNGPNGATALPVAQLDMLNPASKSPTLRLLRDKVAETTTETERPRVELTGLGFHWPNASLTHRMESVVGYNPVRPKRYSDAVGAGDSSGSADQRAFPPLFPSYRATLANLLGLRFIATGKPIQAIDKRLAEGELETRGLSLIAATADGFVYENRAALPRVLYATRAETADFDALVATGNWPGIDYRRTVLLERGSFAHSPRRPGTARIIMYRPTEVVIEADGLDGGWLVLNDMWHPWWRVTVDGETVPMLKANVLFRAVFLAGGRHRVVFRFQPVRGALAEAFAGQVGIRQP